MSIYGAQNTQCTYKRNNNGTAAAIWILARSTLHFNGSHKKSISIIANANASTNSYARKNEKYVQHISRMGHQSTSLSTEWICGKWLKLSEHSWIVKVSQAITIPTNSADGDNVINLSTMQNTAQPTHHHIRRATNVSHFEHFVCVCCVCSGC